MAYKAELRLLTDFLNSVPKISKIKISDYIKDEEKSPEKVPEVPEI